MEIPSNGLPRPTCRSIGFAGPRPGNRTGGPSSANSRHPCGIRVGQCRHSWMRRPRLRVETFGDTPGAVLGIGRYQVDPSPLDLRGLAALASGLEAGRFQELVGGGSDELRSCLTGRDDDPRHESAAGPVRNPPPTVRMGEPPWSAVGPGR